MRVARRGYVTPIKKVLGYTPSDVQRAAVRSAFVEKSIEQEYLFCPIRRTVADLERLSSNFHNPLQALHFDKTYSHWIEAPPKPKSCIRHC
ncbi:hypothetical protein EVAR_26705_1 [Eumeta japonica]|uniref:Uncharacterized protein n=1 Tax=Eumeta variegata TaxID=151549 RepID=A0A4C1ZVQ7_EUMVA|nr:hypothetical protein EVAR_26705_1 [Eumeta japonica]